jgi:DNA repair protein RadD
MVTKEDRDLALNAITDLIPRGLNSEKQWLKRLLYDGENDPEIEEIKTLMRDIAPTMGWNILDMEIPNEMIPRLVVDSLGNNLLMSKKIRRFICERYLEIKSEQEIDGLMQLVGCSTAQELMQKMINQKFTRASSSSFGFCKALKIPTSFVIKNPSRKTEALIVTRTTEPLKELMPFQKMVKAKIQSEFTKPQGRALVVMPTGSGKTRTSTQSFIEAIAEEIVSPNGIVWIADREELQEQAIQTMKTVAERLCPIELNLWRYWDGNDCELIEEDSQLVIHGIVVCGKQQLDSRYSNDDQVAKSIIANSNIIVVDEAHRNLDWISELDTELKTTGSSATLIGLTATPFRREPRENRILSAIFPQLPITPVDQDLATYQDIKDAMVNEGILARQIDRKPTDYGITNNSTNVSEQRDVTNQIVEALVADGHESILVFCRTVEWSRICNMVLSLKHPELRSEYVHGGTPSRSRSKIIEEFREGRCKVLFNCELLTTGFDAPRIDAVVIARNTEPSDPLFIQMVGRGLRGPRFDENVKETCTIIHQRW